VGDDDQPLSGRESDRHEPELILRMPRVENGAGQGIAEDCRRLIERQAVLRKILRCFLGIPLELHASSYDDCSWTGTPDRKRPNAGLQRRAGFARPLQDLVRPSYCASNASDRTCPVEGLAWKIHEK
jgi:hypothetical protein